MKIEEFEGRETGTTMEEYLQTGSHYFTSILGSFAVGDIVIGVGDTLMLEIDECVQSRPCSSAIVSNEYVKFVHVHVSHKKKL